jgi:beta-xylosidase
MKSISIPGMILLGTVAGAFIFGMGPSMEARGAKGPFLFSYFINNGEDGLHLAFSRDGFTWKALNGGKSFLKPEAGKDKLMRDPSVLQGPDGYFHMVWTVSWKERGIGYARSRDLMHWSEQKYLPVMEHEAAAQNCWAPEIVYDDRNHQYMILWSTTIPGRFPDTDSQSSQSPPAPGLNHRIYCVTSKDMESVSPTRLLYDPGFNVIDAAIIKSGNRYAMFLKDETNLPFKPQKNIRIAFAEKMEGPYGSASGPITGNYWAEGPSAIKAGDSWILYFDKYREKTYGALTSKDMIHWQDISDRIVFPDGARHGTAFRVSESILSVLPK